MLTFKKIKGMRDLKSCRLRGAGAMSLIVVLTGGANAESCIAPLRPFVPNDPQDARDYANIIRRDFELYIRDVQSYFRCLEVERARAFEEAREVSEEYGRFLGLVEQ